MDEFGGKEGVMVIYQTLNLNRFDKFIADIDEDEAFLSFETTYGGKYYTAWPKNQIIKLRDWLNSLELE